MCKKLFFLFSFFLAFGVAGSVSEASYYWDNNYDDGLWVTADNWTDNRSDHSGGQVPTLSDNAYIYGTTNLINEANCVIGSGDSAVCKTLKIGQYTGGAALDVVGTLDTGVYPTWIGATGSGGGGSQMTVDGGTVDTDDLYIGTVGGDGNLSSPT